MRIVEQSWQFEEDVNGAAILRKIEMAGRTCYKSEDRITEESASKFVAGVIKSGHHSVIEHHNITVKIITDRGVTHEIVRHRIASYSQESTRYCNYSHDKFGNEITVVLPVWFKGLTEDNLNRTDEEGRKRHVQYAMWKASCEQIEKAYFELLDAGQSPQEARAVLPNSLKTELVMTANLREWRHFFNLRASKRSHPQLRDLATDMLDGFRKKVPVLFDDIQF
ncbi:MAG: FAD-dependent thymidylate synthase [Nitrospirae bacterium]|nr:FAD-dependent thymidylate synthase [Nitrospirota bacterium]